MKQYSIYLHEEIINALKCFGELDDVVNRAIVSCTDDGSAYQEVLNPAPPRDDAKRVVINLPYDTVSRIVGFKLRPFLYWFIEQEKYQDLAWQVDETNRKNVENKIKNQIRKTLSEMSKLNNMLNGRIDNLLKEMENIFYET
jgi:hypothetical protein